MLRDRFLSVAAGAALLALTPLTATAAAAPPLHEGMRGARYCEIIVLRRTGRSFIGDVYNTFGLNDCPERTWKAVDAKALARTMHAPSVLLNGPRYFMVDAISLAQPGPITELGGLGVRRP